MKFKGVWYLDSAKQHPPLKFPDPQNVLNWSVSCRFCSQKFNLLLFLIGIADHAGPLVQYFCSQKINLLVFLIGIADHARPLVMHRTKWRKGRKKPKATLKLNTDLAVRPRIFYGPFLPIWYCIDFSFCYLDAVCSAATSSSLCGFHVAFHMLRLLDDIPDTQEGYCK
jgi:hypothetical protein